MICHTSTTLLILRQGRKRKEREETGLPSLARLHRDGCSSGTIAVGTDPDSCTLAQRPPREPHHVLEYAEFQDSRPRLESEGRGQPKTPKGFSVDYN